MELLNKQLKPTDIKHRFSVPSRSLQHIDFAGEFSVDLRVKDSSGELRAIRCKKRARGYDKPVLSKGWRQYVADYELSVGDRVVLLAEEDRRLGSHYRIEAKRTIILFGHEVCEKFSSTTTAKPAKWNSPTTTIITHPVLLAMESCTSMLQLKPIQAHMTNCHLV
ncbi:hypothetical protein SADUNF_Sadunf01G0174100 [Salix dunnii]|uniref:TF-B3 domain-containing protein n=1 Tax=Salix dunnii TaxID=1413687 RepID=A0A835NCC4_9ROSI|nr:hypothetical protein SADUNF_Sadunf01G0174100 [Salix dunnii]